MFLPNNFPRRQIEFAQRHPSNEVWNQFSPRAFRVVKNCKASDEKPKKKWSKINKCLVASSLGWKDVKKTTSSSIGNGSVRLLSFLLAAWLKILGISCDEKRRNSKRRWQKKCSSFVWRRRKDKNECSMCRMCRYVYYFIWSSCKRH